MGCRSLQIEGGGVGTSGRESPGLGRSCGTFEILGEKMDPADPPHDGGGSGSPAWTLPRSQTTAPECGAGSRESDSRDSRRSPAPRGTPTILYDLNRDPALTPAGLANPRSTRPIGKILNDPHRRVRPGPRPPAPEERPEPGGVGPGFSGGSAGSPPILAANPRRGSRSSRRTSGRCQPGRSGLFGGGRLGTRRRLHRRDRLASRGCGAQGTRLPRSPPAGP